MAKTTAPPEETAPVAAQAAPAQQKLPVKKLIMFGVPLLLIQLVLVYFLITKVLAPAAPAAASADDKTAEGKAGGEKGGHGSEKKGEGGESAEGSIYVVKDLIVNPAGTNGTRFLLTTIGFEVTTAEGLKEIELKDVMVRDALNTILTSKDLLTLVNMEGRESVRKEIEEKVSGMLRNGRLTNVYFSKFIIQ
jgi:flagellar FliL protein